MRLAPRCLGMIGVTAAGLALSGMLHEPRSSGSAPARVDSPPLAQVAAERPNPVAEERPTCAPGPTEAPAALLGAAGGAIHALAIFGDVAYAGLGSRLVVLDLSDPTAARVIGQSPSLGSRVTGIHVSGAYAYVATAELGLQIVAVSDLTAPRLEGAIALDGGARAIAGIGNYVLVAGQGWHMVDVADPALPHRLVTLEARRTLTAVAVTGTGAFFAGEDGVLVAYDIAQPEAPLWRSELRIGGLPLGLAAVDDHVFLAGSGLAGSARQHGMAVVDVSHPDAMKPATVLEMPDAALAISARRDRAYLLSSAADLHVVDIARPASPVAVAMLRLERSAGPAPAAETGGAVAATTGRAFAGFGSALHTVGLADPARPALLGASTVGWPAYETVTRGDLAFVAAGTDGLRVLDAGGPAAPRELGLWREASGAPITDLALAPSGEQLFLAAGSAGLIVLDIKGKPVPSVMPVGRLDAPAPVRRVLVSGSRAYLAVGDAELWVVDIADPAAPVHKGSLTLAPEGSTPTPRISDLAVRDHTVFVATAFSGLSVIDAFDAALPRRLSHSPRGGDRVALAGEHVLTVRADQDLRVFSAVNPAALIEVGRFLDPELTLRDVVVGGEHALVAAVPDPRSGSADRAPGQLLTLDLADPAAPRLRDSDALPAAAEALTAAGELVFAAAGAEGLIVARPAYVPPPRSCRAFLPLAANGDPPPKPLVARRLWQWVNVNRPADRKDLRLADWDGDGRMELLVADGDDIFSLEGSGAGDRPSQGDGPLRLHTEWIAEAPGLAWGVDEIDGDERPELWSLSASGLLSVFAPDRAGPEVQSQLDIGEGMSVRAAIVAELAGSGARSLLVLLAPVPGPPPQPAAERWQLRAWSLPELTPGWRFAIERVDPGLAADRLLVAQVDDDPAREIVLSFPGGKRPGSSFPHGWVIDPAQSAAQWLRMEGFGAQVAAADVDGDGREELIGTPVESTGIKIAAYDADERAEKWQIDRSPQPLQVADISGDGLPEIIAGGGWGAIDIYDAGTQARVRELRAPGLVGGIVGLTVGNVDGRPGADLALALSPADGGPGRLLVLPAAELPERDALPSHSGPYHPVALRPEGAAGPPAVALFPDIGASRALSTTHLVLDGATGRERPELRLELDAPGAPPLDPSPLAVDLDADPFPEVLVGLGDVLHVLDHDGRRIRSRDFGVPAGPAEPLVLEPRPVWAGDLDGAGGEEGPQIVVAARRRVAVLRLADLSVAWSIPVPESDQPEVLVADIDADGVPELVLRGRGTDVQAWDGRRREREWLLPGTAWTVDAIAAGRVDPGGPVRLAVLSERRVTWYAGPDLAASAGPDLWRGAEQLRLAEVLGTPQPQLLATDGETVYVYAHPDDPDPALAIPIGAPVEHLDVADVDGDGLAEIVVGTAEGLRAYRVE